MKVLFLTQTPGINGSSKYRVSQYVDCLRKNGIESTVLPALSEEQYLKWSPSKAFLAKISYFGTTLLRRLWDIHKVRKFDVVFLQRDIIPYFPPVLERMMRSANANLVFDFDDAIFAQALGSKSIFARLCDPRRIPKILRMSREVIVGNNFLKDYAMRHNGNVTVIPTPIDTGRYSVKDRDIRGKTVIGWSGSISTNHNVNRLIDVINRLSTSYDIQLNIISNTLDGIKLEKIAAKVNFIRYRPETEVSDLHTFDIGVMPLEDSVWGRGKCSFKALQYMGVGIPPVISPVGMNNEVVKEGENGFFADSDEEWLLKLARLIEDPVQRKKIGGAARKTVEDRYSVKVNAHKLISVLEKACRSCVF